jgi:hypothetical protein
MGLRQLACWDCGFESRLGYRCVSLVSVVCCVGSGLCVGRFVWDVTARVSTGSHNGCHGYDGSFFHLVVMENK